MFGKRKKAPSVRIPASVLRKEAQKAAKKMLAAERKKERTKILREKAKARAKTKIAKSKSREKKSAEFKQTPIYKEIIGWSWIGLGIILFTIFLITISMKLYDKQKNIKKIDEIIKI